MTFKNKFSNLGHPRKIWTVSAIHGQLDRLVDIHKSLFAKFQPGHRLVYTGNYLAGENAAPLETLDELLYFRRTLMAQPGVEADDIVFLRGRQEEIFDKLLQLQFAHNAREVVDWIAQHCPEIDFVLAAYNSSLGEASRVAREGTMCVTRWTNFLRNQIKPHAGHEKFFTVLRRAAFTEHVSDNDNLLFVHAGVDPQLPLLSQGDNFWWANKPFDGMQAPYAPFRSVVRGFDPEHKGVQVGPVSISLDGGCGYGGKLVCAQISNNGDILELLAA